MERVNVNAWYEAVVPYRPELNGPLTLKQDTLLMILEDEPEGVRCGEISDRMRDPCREFEAGDLTGTPEPGPCIGWNAEQIAGALCRMEKRGLVKRERRDGEVRWHALVYV